MPILFEIPGNGYLWTGIKCGLIRRFGDSLHQNSGRQRNRCLHWHFHLHTKYRVETLIPWQQDSLLVWFLRKKFCWAKLYQFFVFFPVQLLREMTVDLHTWAHLGCQVRGGEYLAYAFFPVQFCTRSVSPSAPKKRDWPPPNPLSRQTPCFDNGGTWDESSKTDPVSTHLFVVLVSLSYALLLSLKRCVLNSLIPFWFHYVLTVLFVRQVMSFLHLYSTVTHQSTI